MADVTPGWDFLSIDFEGGPVLIEGLRPWKMPWHSIGEPPITVAHPSYPLQRHSMSVYELRTAGRVARFAAGEFSNGVWGFYTPSAAAA